MEKKKNVSDLLFLPLSWGNIHTLNNKIVGVVDSGVSCQESENILGKQTSEEPVSGKVADLLCLLITNGVTLVMLLSENKLAMRILNC